MEHLDLYVFSNQLVITIYVIIINEQSLLFKVFILCKTLYMYHQSYTCHVCSSLDYGKTFSRHFSHFETHSFETLKHVF